MLGSLDFIEEKRQLSSLSIHDVLDLRMAIAEAFKRLTKREQKVISMLFGLESYEHHTLKEVGEEFGVTRERIRQIEIDALKKLKKDKKLPRL